MFSKKNKLLKMVFWEITSGCNLHCRHCRNDSSGKQMQGELDVTEIDDAVNNLLKFSRPSIILSGGEPMLRKDIFEIVKRISAKELRVSIASNGTLLTRDSIKKLKDAGIAFVAVSIDGKDSKAHDDFRGMPGSFNKIKDALVYLKEKNVPLQINTTVTRHNFSQIKEIADLARKWGARAMHIFLLVSIGCAKNIADNDRITPRQCEDLLTYIDGYSAKFALRIKPICAPFYLRILKQSQKNAMVLAGGCLAARDILFISSTGEVYPCGYLPVAAGNIKKDGIGPIWDNSELFNKLRQPDKLKGRCLRCEFQFDCGGGCRARAYAQTQDYLSEDPYCLYEPQVA